MSKPYDIVLFGATSFVGKLICDYMISHPSMSQLNWAIAARSQSKIDVLVNDLGPSAAGVPTLLADANDYDSLITMCHQARVIMSTVGPYDLYGELLVRACAESGTDYCDLTGEPHWIKKMLDSYEETAQASGARIVHCTGFDSIPSDLGVYFLQREASKQFGTPCTAVKMRIKNMRGAASGGTIATALNMAQQLKNNPEIRRELVNPYSLCPENHGFKTRQQTIKVVYDETFKKWVGPFFMSSINTKIVHRSNALSNPNYGDHFTYSEGMMTGHGFKGKLRAKSIYWGLASFFTGISIAPIRAFLTRFVLPKPGEGPTTADQKNGFYDFRFVGNTEKGEQIMAQVYGDMDPGYGSTAKIMAQAAACLAFDVPADTKGGFWTTATLLGDPLIDRLNKHAGLTFKILSNEDNN